MTQCLDIIRSQNVSKLLEWLVEDDSCRWIELMSTLREHVDKKDVATFCCEHVRFLATGRFSKVRQLFDDENLNAIATGLGNGSIHSTIDNPILPEQEQITVKRYTFEDFDDLLEAACDRVEPSLAFVAAIEYLRHCHSNIERILRLLEKTITRCTDRAPRITTAAAALSQVFQHYKDLSPCIGFLQRMWVLDMNDMHNVSKASLTSLVLQMHTSVICGKASFEDRDAGVHLANLLCCWKNDVLSWVSRICVYSSQTTLCTLDTTPLDEALCCFWLLTDDRSVMPQVYSLQCLVSMHIKVTYVLVSNDVDAQFNLCDMVSKLCARVDTMVEKSGYLLASPPDDIIMTLLRCCSLKPLSECALKTIQTFMQLLPDDGQVDLFCRVSSRCSTDASLATCLRTLGPHLLSITPRLQMSIIMALKSLLKRIIPDVCKFHESLDCILTWIESLHPLVEADSQGSKLSLDIHHALTQLIVDGDLSAEHNARLLTVIEPQRSCKRLLQYYGQVVKAHHHLVEICGDDVDFLSNVCGLGSVCDEKVEDEHYLLAVIVSRCILVQTEPTNVRNVVDVRKEVHNTLNCNLRSTTGEQCKRKGHCFMNLQRDSLITGVSLAHRIRNPGIFLRSAIFESISKFAGREVIHGILHNRRVLVPDYIFKFSRDVGCSLLLGENATPEELKIIRSFLRDVVIRMDSIYIRQDTGNLVSRPFVFIQLTGTVMYNDNFCVSMAKGTWSHITLSRNLMLYKDSFNGKFGFGRASLLEAVVELFTRHGRESNSTDLRSNEDAFQLNYSTKNNHIRTLFNPAKNNRPFIASNANDRFYVPLENNTIHSSVVWKLFHFVLFDKGFVHSQLKERYNRVRNFIGNLTTVHRETVKRHRGLMSSIYPHFKKLLYNIRCLDLRGEYWSYFGDQTISDSEKNSGIDHNRVISFVHKVVERVVPRSLLGCEENFARLKDVCRSIVVLNKGENLDMSQVMQGFKATGCPWYGDKSVRLSRSKVRTILEYICRLVFLILEHMVIPLLRRHFYVTEADFSMYRLLYFRKADWHRMVMLANEAYTSDPGSIPHERGHRRERMSAALEDMTRPVTVSDPDLSRYGALGGCIRVRWIPKLSGMRPIMNCNTANVTRFGKYTNCSVNSMMRMPFQALTAHIRMNPRFLGHGILGYTGVFRSIKQWWARFMRMMRHSTPRKNFVTLYVTLADLSRCYEHIKHGYLLRLLSSMKIQGNLLFKHIYRRNLIHVASFPNSYGKRVTYLSNDSSSLSPPQIWSLLSCSFGQFSIYSRYVNRDLSQHVSKSDIVAAVKMLLSRCSTSLPKCSPSQLFHKNVGIPQGCCISPLLCSLYLAQGDLHGSVRKLVGTNSANLLLRWIDDFIFISNGEEDTVEMLKILRDTSVFGMAINDKLFTMRLDLPVSRNSTKLTHHTSSSNVEVVDGFRKPFDNTVSRMSTRAESCTGLRDSVDTNGEALLSWINCSFDFDLVRGRLNATLIPWKNELCSIRDSLKLSKKPFTTPMFAYIEQRVLGYIANRLKHGLFTNVELNTQRCILQNSYVVMRIATMKAFSFASALLGEFRGFMNPKYIGKLTHKMVDYALELISLGGLDIRNTRLRDLLQLAVINTFSSTWHRRLRRRYSRRNIAFSRAIERLFKGKWPSYGHASPG
ncbi:-Telomerase reverse transcriptase [Babesia bigemina]|uniref:Telomerase reverse transcriptase n=1 Tax=Babesia bigemina TaxID=5866 RepID=A0A061DBZ7_BABBI|nr:-Telomerase reverse transcriptase [Babesia bigemina]CDR98108.1 -Telomerase reverse transcriptase [Babesia bigemina]|eukprot:XP_012770294.1 -Telomerase reverse transcriptase [Babesia bigemina]